MKANTSNEFYTFTMKTDIRDMSESRVGLGCKNKANCPHVEPGPILRKTLGGGLSKGS